MEKRKLNRITAGFIVLVVMVLILMFSNSLRRSSHITLPEEGSSPGQTEDDTNASGGDALTVIAVTPETVQTAIETLTRPRQYSRVIRVEQLWDGGSGSFETTVTVSGRWTRTDRSLSDGQVRHTITDGEITYIWYGSESSVYSAPAGDITPDDEQAIPTYESILDLPVEDIAAADYRSVSDVNCIYVETVQDPEGYTQRYWVSVETGLLVASERLLEGETIYRMASLTADLSTPSTDRFILPDGTVLRISISRATVGMIAVGMIQPLLIVLIVALILSGLLARRLSRRIVDPLNSLDLEHPLDNDAYEELSPLLKRIHHQHVEIQTQLRELREKTDEFTQITGSMREGLVLLDEHGSILSINAAAQALFGADAQCVGRDFLTIERSHEISAAIQAAAADGHSEVRAERAGRVYQFDISRITSDGKFLGTVILAFDITEQEFAERNRREFTANVSHELKTPLQGIIGSAELIENGMVRPDDLPRFVGHIHAEAARLVTLIDDIIRLSQLDEEKVQMEKRPVDLHMLASDVVKRLQDVARKNQITLMLTGKPTVVNGNPQILDEMIYNLCDNAIKYNKPFGEVEVNVVTVKDHPVLTVEDDGIGIPIDDQERIFERFYRVDKSHSRQIGGTGLGLSIVKHGAIYHKAKVELKSALGEGTTVRIVF